MKRMKGLKFGRLEVLTQAAPQINPSGRKRIRWKCLCECGKEVEVLGEKLRNRNTVSCGCYGLERRTKHGFTRGKNFHLLYGVWRNIKSRCFNPNFPQYCDYGGRGIDVCEEWLNDPEAFISWSLKNGWRQGLDCDRKKNNEGYSPDNCRYITRLENLSNRRPYRKKSKARIGDPF